MKIEYEINDKSAKKVLNRLHSNNKHRRPAMKDITRILMKSTDDTFEKEGRQPKWPKLKKPRKGKILQLSKKLINSMNGSSDNDSSTLATSVIYGPTHQYGDPERNISKRTFLEIRREDIKNSQMVLTKHLMRGI